MDSEQLEEIKVRLDKLEKQGIQDVMLLLEIMSSVTFFGKIKKINCEYAREDQCSFFFLKKEEKNKLPIAMDCRIIDCKDIPSHRHLELSNLTCTFCPVSPNLKYSDQTMPNVDEGTRLIREH